VIASTARPAFVYAYLAVLDEVAHEHGIGSEAARATLHALDAELARFARGPRAAGPAAGHGGPRLRRLARGAHHPRSKPRPALAGMLERPLWGERRVARGARVRPEARARFAREAARALPEARYVEAAALVAGGWMARRP